jgi:hypothetical protein
MITPELVSYIKSQLALGIDRQALTASLLGQGWSVADIQEAFNSLNSNISSINNIGINLQPKKTFPKFIYAVIAILLVVAGAIYFLLPKNSNVKKLNIPITEIPTTGTGVSPVNTPPTASTKALTCSDFSNLLTVGDLNSTLGAGSAITLSKLDHFDDQIGCEMTWKGQTANGSYYITFNGMSMGGKILSFLGTECAKVKVGDKSVIGTTVQRKADLTDLGDRESCLVVDNISKSVYFTKNLGALRYDPLLAPDQQIQTFDSLSVTVDAKYTDNQAIDLAKLLFSHLNEKLK